MLALTRYVPARWGCGGELRPSTRSMPLISTSARRSYRPAMMHDTTNLCIAVGGFVWHRLDKMPAVASLSEGDELAILEFPAILPFDDN